MGQPQPNIPLAVAQGVLAGKKEDIAQAYGLMAQRVMTLSYRLLQDRQLAEEVVQDTFVELINKGTEIKSATAVAAWIKRVAVNHSLMKLRSPWVSKRNLMSEEDLHTLQDEHHLHEDSGDSLMGTDHSDPAEMRNVNLLKGSNSDIGQLMALLSADARTVLWLHEVEGYTHKEIGQFMGKTASFSKSQLSRAYQRLLTLRQNSIQPNVQLQCGNER